MELETETKLQYWRRKLDGRDYVFVPTVGRNEARCANVQLSQAVDYLIMQQPNKHFSFRKSFHKAFPTSEKKIESTRASWQASIYSSLANLDLTWFS
jgi:hypothetical protein